MANEIQRFYWGSQSSPVAVGNVEAGTFTLTFDSEETTSLNPSDDAATIQAALEALTTIGSGNVLVELTANGFTVEFQGTLANTNVVQTFDTLTDTKQKADTITLNVIQVGGSPVSCVPSINTITSNIEGANAIQQVDLGGATTGTFYLDNGVTSGEVTSLDASGVQAACDTVWGSGNTSVTGSGPFDIEFINNLALQEIEEMTVTTNTTDGSPTVTQIEYGSTPVSQVDQVTFDSVAIAGGMIVDSQSLDWDQSADAFVIITGATVSATTPASGSIEIVWDDDQPHTPVALETSTLISAVGQLDILDVSLPDSPTEGDVYIHDFVGSATILFNDDAGSVETKINDGDLNTTVTCTGAGTAGSPWRLTSVNEGDYFSAWTFEESTPLRKSVNAEIVTVQEGEAAATTPDAPSNLVATPLSASVIRLTWTDESDNEDAFEIERSPDGVSDWSQIGTTAANAVLFDSTGLTAETQYFYRVRAANGAGESDWVEADATTDAAPGGDSGSAFPFLFNSGILG